MISTASVAGVGYYTGGGGDRDEEQRAPGTAYYTGSSEKGEPPGRGSGRLAEPLGLEGGGAGPGGGGGARRDGAGVRGFRGAGRDGDRPTADAVPVDRVPDRA